MLKMNVSHHINKLIVASLLILLAIVIYFLFWLSPVNAPTASQTAQINPTTNSIANQPIQQIAPNIDTSDADHLIQGLEIFKDEHLKITKKTQQLLDTFLGSSSQTESNDAITLAKNQMNKTMKEPAAMEAAILLEHYAAYKKALTEIDVSTSPNNQQMSDDNLMAGVKIQRISALRNQYLSPEIVQVFYAIDNSNAQYELARQRIMSINGLNDEQRQEELTALQNQFQQSTTLAP